MTELEKTGIRHTMELWTEASIKYDTVPVLLIGIPIENGGRDIQLWRAGPYSPAQVKTILEALIDLLPLELTEWPDSLHVSKIPQG